MRKSLLQYQKRIKTEPTHDEECFPLSNLEDINRRFQNYCEEQGQWVQMQMQSEPMSPLQLMRHASTLVHMESKKFIKPLKQEEEFQREKVHFFVERYFNKPKEKQETIHQLVRIQIDVLQSTLLDALIMNSARNEYQIDMMGTAQKLLKAFNISPIMLAQKNTATQRQEYIVRQFQETVNTLMKDWRMRLIQKQRKLKQEDEQFKKDQVRNKESKEDIFHWLSLKTKYEVLQKKLKEMLMERINQYENQLKLSKSHSMVHLEGIARIKTSELVTRSDPKAGVFLKALAKRNNNTPIVQPEQIDDEFIWNGVLERKFLKERNRGKEKFFPIVQSSNFNHLAYMPLFDELSPEDPSHFQRDLKMAKYENGDWLTVEELQFMANTSKLLNSCLNHQQIKHYVSIIKPKQIQQLETNLSEKIIDNYEKMVKKIQASRIEWLRKHIKQTKKQIIKTDREKEKQATFAINKKINEKQKKRLEVICQKMQNNISIKDEVQQNFYAQIFVKVVMNRIRLIRERKEEDCKKYNEDYEKEQLRKKLFKEKIIKLSKPYSTPVVRKHHPTSKLGHFGQQLKEYDPESVEGQTLQKRIEYMNEKVKEYRVSYGRSENQDCFVKFYSNGPNRGVREEPIFDPLDPDKPPKLSVKELNQIILIQQSYRKYISEKKMRHYKEYYYNKKYKSYYQKLERMVLAKKFNKFLKDSLSKTRSLATDQDEVTRMKTQQTESPSKTRRSQMLSPTSPTSQLISAKAKPQVKLIKHNRLLRYAKVNLLAGVIKGGFVYSKEDVNIRDEDKICPLYYAATHGNIAFVEYLIGSGADPNLKCANGDTPLHMAFKSDNLHIIMMMLSNGGNLNNVNEEQQTPLIYGRTQTLKNLGLLDGVCSLRSNDGEQKKWDNNALLQGKKQNELSLY